ncbi:U5 small nuclear ribonucleoprotein 200 kDa helicase [Drosophila madeirensis]|uniref:U5 small nuclear ribonucleoprotein 200 kDa helicase n=1 Tax=Drosophila madeirensis TaxID=30013 RepID=A0AAU9FTU1_DROMD
MLAYNQLLRHMQMLSETEIDLIRDFLLSKKFHHISVRNMEKLELQQRMEHVLVPFKESIEEHSAKDLAAGAFT